MVGCGSFGYTRVSTTSYDAQLNGNRLVTYNTVRYWSR